MLNNFITYTEFLKLYPTLETIDYLNFRDKLKIGQPYNIDSIIEKRKLEKMNDLFKNE